jgi:ElaB/YqjD/DUF883 family membrane-anchored ribosome-binding protein
MKNNKETAAQTPKELLSDLEALVMEAEKMLTDSVTEHTTDAVNGLRERFDAANERLGELYVDARKKVAAGAKQTDKAIRENPYQSVAIAAGVGLLLGVILGRRSR